MRSTLSGLTLVLAVVATGLAAYAVLRERAQPSDLDARLQAIEARMGRMETASARPEPEGDDGPRLLGFGIDVRGAQPDEDGSSVGVASRDGRGPADAEAATTTATAAAGTLDSAEEVRVRELIDEAVDRKTARIQAMQQKKPAIDVFADTLELTEEQRAAAERAIVSSQHEIRALLEIPAQDGTVLLDELVEIMAEGMARPGEKSDRGMRWFGRVMTEIVPGTNETYAARAEAAKDRLRDTFRRDWSEEQWATFEAWQMDPSEVQDIEGSPWKDLEARLIERARQLGADLPDEER